jgi:SAM-dependent methyltransferase
MYSDLINIFILIIIFIISIHIFKIFKIYDQREINKQYDMIPYENIEVTKDTERQHEPYNYSDVYEYGIFKTHPFKHPNDMDYYLAELRNGMVILDAGCGLLGASLYFANNLPKSKIHVISNGGTKYQNEITKKIKKNHMKDKIIPHFNDYHNMNKIFKNKKFDRIIFIESIGYSNNILNLLEKSKNLLKIGGKIYIRTIIMPNTSNLFLRNQYSKIQQHLNGYIHYHENMIYFLQKSGFYNIKYTSVPLIFSENMNNPIFMLTMNKLGLISPSKLLAGIPLMSATYIATKID